MPKKKIEECTKIFIYRDLNAPRHIRQVPKVRKM